MKRISTLLLALAASALLLGANPAAALADGTAVTWDLIAGRSYDVGSVTVDRVGDDLQVRLQADPGWLLTEVHVYAGPVRPTHGSPGQFPYGGTLATPASEHTVSIALSAIGAASGGTVYVAAHAVVTPASEFRLVSGDGRAVVTAFDDVPLDPWRPAVLCWCHPHWAEHILPGFEGTDAECIWRSLFVSLPYPDPDDLRDFATTGEIVDFLDAFRLSPGIVVEQATLTMACDNGYEVYLNGSFVGSEGLMEGWRDSDLTDPYVVQWDWLHGPMVYDVTDLVRGGSNEMTVGTANEQFDGGTDGINPAGLIYCLYVKALVPGSPETAWADGLDGTPIRVGKSWGTYVAYGVP